MPGDDQHTMDEAVHEQRVGAAAPRAEEGAKFTPEPKRTGVSLGEGVDDNQALTPAGNNSRARSGQPRHPRRITQAEHAALAMKKGKHIKALLWVDPKGQKVLATMVEGETVIGQREAAAPQGWLDAGWRIASWFANPKTGNMQITLIRAI